MSRKINQEYPAVSTEISTQAINLQNYRSFSCQVSISNGVTFTSTVSLEVSNDQLNWTVVTGTDEALDGVTATQMYDIVSSSVGYARIKIAPATGSADFKLDYVLK